MKETLHNKPLKVSLYGINLQSVVPIRREPQEQSEMTSQLLFGEYYQVEEVREKWLRIITLFDAYPGWIDSKLFAAIPGADFRQYGSFRPTVLASKLAEIEYELSSSLIISAGSSLPGYDAARKCIVVGGRELTIRPLSGDITLPSSRKLTATAFQFMNVPYLWGGRSTFGMDCSGFVQTVFSIHGIPMPRDASQQVQCGTTVSTAEYAGPGDLAFFGSDQASINHVGIVTEPGEIIHCSGWVRIDKLDKDGIFNRSTQKYTHKLQCIKRISGAIR
jgi:gamma-D-glutamyl-L-lysine dipeptidyl-peptidase